MPFSARFTVCTCLACSAMLMFLWSVFHGIDLRLTGLVVARQSIFFVSRWAVKLKDCKKMTNFARNKTQSKLSYVVYCRPCQDRWIDLRRPSSWQAHLPHCCHGGLSPGRNLQGLAWPPEGGCRRGRDSRFHGTCLGACRPIPTFTPSAPASTR